MPLLMLHDSRLFPEQMSGLAVLAKSDKGKSLLFQMYERSNIFPQDDKAWKENTPNYDSLSGDDDEPGKGILITR